jgi:hypothetical protein
MQMPSRDTAAAVPAGTVSPSDSDGHRLTYYPGTTNPDEAQSIGVGIAQEAHASFALVPSRMTRVIGIIRNSQGKPAGDLMLGLRSRSGNGMMFSRAVPSVGSDVSFTLANVPPGEHWLEVVPRDPAEETGGVAITAGDGDITGLVITTTTGVLIQGHVTFEGSFTSGSVFRPCEGLGEKPYTY